MELRDFWNIIRKRKLIVSLVAICVIAGYSLFFFSQEPTFTSKSKILLRTPSQWKETNVLSMPDRETRISLINSRPVLDKVSKKLEESDKNISRSKISSNVYTKTDDKTDFVQIYYEETSSEKAISVNKILTKTFIEFDRKNNLESFRSAEKLVEKQFNTAKSKLNEYEKKLTNFKKNEKIYSAKNQLEGNLDRIYSLNDQKLDLRYKKINLQNKLKKFHDMLEKNTQVSDTQFHTVQRSLTQSITSELTSAKIKLFSLQQELGPKHPKIVRTKEQIKALKNELKKSVRDNLNSLPLFGNQELRKKIFQTTMQLQMTKVQEAQISEQFNRIENKMEKVSEARSRLVELRRRIDFHSKRFKSLRNQLDQVQFNKSLLDKSGKIISLPDSTSVSYPVKYRTYGFVLLAALVFGIGAGGFLEYLNNKIESRLDIHRYLKLPVLGTIPHIDEESVNLIHLPKKTPLTERYHSITVRLQYSLLNKQDRQTVLVASSIRGEGKTSTVLNLGVSLAREGEKVLLIDLDLRDPMLHKKFELMNSNGATNVLNGKIQSEYEINNLENDNTFNEDFSWEAVQGVIEQTEQKGLDVLPTGPIPSNPLEILKNDNLKYLLNQAQENYSLVLIDSPPLASVVDSIIIANECDGVITVARSGVVNKSQLIHTKRLISDADTTLMGVILNDVSRHYSSYYAYYSSYYADTEAEKV